MNLDSLRGHPCSPPPRLPSLVAVLLVVPVASYFLWKNDPLIAKENGLLEIAQAIFLLLASVLHSERAFRLKKSALDFTVHAGLALLTLSFALREIEIDEIGSSELWASAERIIRLAAAILWIGFLVFLVPRIRQIYSCRSAILAMPAVILTLCGGLFFLAGWPFDKEIFSALSHASSALIEEVLELNACITLLAASLVGSSQRHAATVFGRSS
ncbi:MAG: hypothetical protein V7606_4631 [Burkholderiales bacterium]